MKLYIVRHGQTDYNVKGLLQGLSDINLNKEGINQAQELGKKLKNKKINLIISSPLRRAMETAYYLNLDCPIFIDERIIERDLGIYEGKPRTLYDFNKYMNYHLNSNDDGVEPIQHLFERITKFLDYLKTNYEDLSIVVVTHGAVMKVIPYYFDEIKEDEIIKSKTIDNCGYLYYEI